MAHGFTLVSTRAPHGVRITCFRGRIYLRCFSSLAFTDALGIFVPRIRAMLFYSFLFCKYEEAAGGGKQMLLQAASLASLSNCTVWLSLREPYIFSSVERSTTAESCVNAKRCHEGLVGHYSNCQMQAQHRLCIHRSVQASHYYYYCTHHQKQ